MNSILRTSLSLSAIVGIALSGVLASGCVASRPARNGVFNENVYLRKDFLVRAGTPGADGKPASDPGWFVNATITETSSPNPLVSAPFYLYPGYHFIGKLVRFRATQDHLQMVEQQEISPVHSEGIIPEMLDAWGATNIDLKYRVNLDGEQTNFYEENQEAPWQQRQWLKLNLAKNDMSDFNLLGMGVPDGVNHCANVSEATATLLPNSVEQEHADDPSNDYLAWTTQVTVPIRTDLAECSAAFEQEPYQEVLNLARPNVTINVKFSMVRAKPLDQITYQPLIVDEKDPIHHKYASLLEWPTTVRDPVSQQLASRSLVLRYDPNKDIVWYFDKNFPQKYKNYFCKPNTDTTKPAQACDAALDPSTIRDQTNDLLAKSGAKARVVFKNVDEDMAVGGKPREFGDVRYNWLRWISDIDVNSGFAGVTEPAFDPRTGEVVNNIIEFNDFALKDYYVQRIDAYLQSLGASEGVNSPKDWSAGPANCKDGDTIPFVQTCDAGKNCLSQSNARNTLYSKMQVYLNRPSTTYGNLGPEAFIQTQDTDFMNAYYAITPYQIFADPDANHYVVREGGKGVYGPGADPKYWQMLKDEAEFHERASEIDHGRDPYDYKGPNSLSNAANFLNRMRDLSTNHMNLKYRNEIATGFIRRDPAEVFSFETMIQKDARHCVNGTWETKDQWVQSLIDQYWQEVLWHEFGHGLGLDHNFMGSIDRNNFPHYKDGAGRDQVALYSNSIMEYTTAPNRLFWHAGWAPWDQAAIGWIYANAQNKGDCDIKTRSDGVKTPFGTCTDGNDSNINAISGQSSKTSPWKDPIGFDVKDATKETQFMSCNSAQTKYTPLCRAGDSGTTPSEIIANEIITEEWQYTWRNFRTYRKFWNNANYANAPINLMFNLKRFLSQWIFDWSTGELADTLRKIGIKNPDPNGSDLQYFGQLTNKFNAEMSAANSMVAAFHKAMIQQGSGERPFGTVYDKFYGDVTQQGIILDKLFAMQSWVGLWPTDNYDQNQAGSYVAAYEGLGDSTFNAIAEDTVDSMVGGQYNVYPYFRPLAVVQFAQDTHSPSFGGRVSVRDWVGGQVFGRLQDFLDYFRNIALNNNYKDPKNGVDCTSQSFDACKYDPRPGSDNHNEFVGPDKRVWIWAFVPDRNEYVAVLKDRNTASYVIVRAYNDDVVTQLDDGAFPGGAYGLELPVKYMLDAFAQYR